MIAVDGEFSGLDPNTDSLVSLGAVHMENPEDRFYMECRIWDGAHINNEALEINGFSIEEVTDLKKQSEAEITKIFLDWAGKIEDQTFVGQNVSFDRNFLAAAAHRAHLDYQIAHRTVDTHTLALMHHIKRGIEVPILNNHSALNLDSILNYVGIPSEPEPHNALVGAISGAEVAHRLLYDKKLLPEFDQHDIPWV